MKIIFIKENEMNLQDFACAISNLVWGGELGWDREDGLEDLFDTIRNKLQSKENSNTRCTTCIEETFVSDGTAKASKTGFVDEKELYTLKTIVTELLSLNYNRNQQRSYSKLTLH